MKELVKRVKIFTSPDVPAKHSFRAQVKSEKRFQKDMAVMVACEAGSGLPNSNSDDNETITNMDAPSNQDSEGALPTQEDNSYAVSSSQDSNAQSGICCSKLALYACAIL